MRSEKGKRLLSAIGNIDDEMIDAAVPSSDIDEPTRKPSSDTAVQKPNRAGKPRDKRTIRRFIAIAASFAVIIGLSLYMFLPLNDAPRISAYEGDEYYPVIEAIAYAYYTPSKYKNNLDRLTSSLVKKDGADSGGSNATPPTDDTGTNGSYAEVTDNQVDGVIEADLVKATDKYIFRLSLDRTAGDTLYLTVYSVCGNDSQRVAKLELMSASDDKYVSFNTAEMYLSADATRVTVIQTVRDKNYVDHTVVQSVDVSDVTNMTVTNSVTVSGEYTDSRMVDGRLLLVSGYSPAVSKIKYADPTTYVPSIDRGEGNELVPMSDIVMPSKATNAKYSVLTLFSEDGLEVIDTEALFNFTDSLYATEDGAYLVHGYRDALDTDGVQGYYPSVCFSEIVCMSWGEGGFEHRGNLTVEGEIKDQYSLDEREGHLRVVTTTTSSVDENGTPVLDNDASLFVFDLSAMTLRASVEYFAPLGESAESVRFDGDKLYVCTALIIQMTDPVYFFDLSDYDNITSTDTGIIDGFSSSLIQLGNGYLLGIGELYDLPKLEIYREENGKVVSVDALVFDGIAPTDYKAYFINRELGLIGMMINDYCELDDEYEYAENALSGNLYVLFQFNGTELVRLDAVTLADEMPDRVRALYTGGYLYILGDNGIAVIEPALVSSTDEVQ